jgi:UDP-3-O-[3-hydroxymyristoyl] glucosamine N-acyltransferase
VEIADNVIIEPNVTILPDVTIGKNCIIRAGAVLGSEGFEHKRTKFGILPVFHDGKVIVGDDVEIGANTCVDKGFAWRNTSIGNQTKIDNLVHIGHGAQVGEKCLITACSQIGASDIGDNVWVGPNANILSQHSIGNSAVITVGAVVTTDVAPGKRVTGNFAIDHQKFIKFIKQIR